MRETWEGEFYLLIPTGQNSTPRQMILCLVGIPSSGAFGGPQNVRSYILWCALSSNPKNVGKALTLDYGAVWPNSTGEGLASSGHIICNFCVQDEGKTAFMNEGVNQGKMRWCLRIISNRMPQTLCRQQCKICQSNWSLTVW